MTSPKHSVTATLGALALLAAAGAARRRYGTANTQRHFDIAWSWKWSPLTGTYFGTGYDDAIYNESNPNSMATQIRSWGDDPSEYFRSIEHRIYAVIEGGERVVNDVPHLRRSLSGHRLSRLDEFEFDIPVFFVWQLEYEIGVQAMTPKEAGSLVLDEIEQVAWRKLDGINYFSDSAQIINGPNHARGFFSPNMVVIGGKLVEIGVLS